MERRKMCLSIFSSILFVVLFSSCGMSINGNYLTLSPCPGMDSIDSRGFKINIVSNVYISDDTIYLIHENGLVDNIEIKMKTEDNKMICYELQNKKVIMISEDPYFGLCLCISNHRNDFISEGVENYKIIKQEYKDNIDTSGDKRSLEEIIKYRLNGEIKGSVKEISWNEYQEVERFGEKELYLFGTREYKYDSFGNKSYEKIKLGRKTVRIQSNYNKGLLLKEVVRNESYDYIYNYSYKDDKLSQIEIQCKKGHRTYANHRIMYEYDKGFKLKEINHFSFNFYDKREELEEKIVYKTKNGNESYHYDEKGELIFKNRYDKEGDFEIGRIELGYTKIIDPFDVYNRLYSYMSLSSRDCKVIYNPYSTIISITYPYKIYCEKRFIANEESEYDINGNMIRHHIEYYGPEDYNSILDYVCQYKYDENGNWTERIKIPMDNSIGKNQEKDKNCIIEKREIVYW